MKCRMKFYECMQFLRPDMNHHRLVLGVQCSLLEETLCFDVKKYTLFNRKNKAELVHEATEKPAFIPAHILYKLFYISVPRLGLPTTLLGFVSIVLHLLSSSLACTSSSSRDPFHSPPVCLYHFQMFRVFVSS